jgi:SAM-dependent methyltransferase
MTRTDIFRVMFKDANLEIDDLLLLESFQIAYLPGWVPEKEFAAVLRAKPEIKKLLILKGPQITGYLNTLLLKYPEHVSSRELTAYFDTVIWTIADLLVYNKYPNVYDQLPFHNWNIDEITSITSLKNKIIVDGGSGTGRVALEVAKQAAIVYAVEPVTRLREFIRLKAKEKNLSNIYVVDGFLHALPFPDHFADLVITSHALGWHLNDELTEFERVVKRPGIIIHCPGTVVGMEENDHQILISPPWSYEFSQYREADGIKRKYWKKLLE